MAGYFKELNPRGQGAQGNPQAQVPAGDQQQIKEIEGETAQTIAADATIAVVGPGAAAAFAAGQAAGVGKGFVFNPQQLDAALKAMDDQLNDLTGDVRDAQDIHQAVQKAPGPDPSTVHATTSASQMTAANLAGVRNHHDTIRDFRQRLQAAKTNYMQQERLTEEQWNRLAGGLDT
ncbi:MAG TPA: hypothetical protein VG317_20255 [Pseudonocardiaceae bacterium]|nr:hypothetical protein [Pseudonocardiaceae bacterium]